MDFVVLGAGEVVEFEAQPRASKRGPALALAIAPVPPAGRARTALKDPVTLSPPLHRFEQDVGCAELNSAMPTASSYLRSAL